MLETEVHPLLDAQLIEFLPVAVGVADMHGNVVRTNPAMRDLFGLEKVHGRRHVMDFVAVRSFSDVQEHLKETVLKGDAITEVFLRRGDDSEFEGWIQSVLVKDAEDRPVGFLGYFKDLSAERAEQAAVQMAEAVVENLQDGVVMHNRSGQIVFANTRAHTMVDVPLGGLVGNFIWERNPEMTPTRWEQHWRHMLTHGQRLIDSVLRTDSGDTIFVEHSVVLHEFEGQQVTLTTSRNVSQRRAQEKQLRRKRFALNNSQTPIVWARHDSKLEYANHAAASLLGYAPHDLLRVPLEQIEIEGAGEVWEHHWQELQFKKRTSRYGHFLHKNGRPIPVQIDQDFMDFEGDQLAVVQFWDISDRIAREAVLEAERSRFKAIVNLAPYGVVLIDKAGFTTEVNQCFRVQCGLVDSGLRKVHYTELVAARDSRTCEPTMRKLLNKEEVYQEKRWKRQDDSWFWGRLRATHLPDENGNVAYIMGIIEDITTEREERRRMMQAEFCMDESADAISLLAKDGSYLYANNSYAELLRIPTEKFEGLRTYDWDVDMDPELWGTLWEDLKAKGTQRLERRFARPDDSEVILDIHRTLREFEGEEVIVSIARDMTERTRYMADLKRARYSLDMGLDAVAWINEKGEFMYANQSYADLIQHDREAMLGMRVQDIDPDMNDQAWVAHWEELRSSTHISMEREVRRKDGTLVPIELSLSYNEFEGQGMNFAVIRDLTQRRLAEREMRESEALFRTLFANSPMGMGMSDANQRIVHTNERLSSMFGYTPEEFKSKEVLDLLDPSMRDYQLEQYARIIHEGEQVKAPLKYVRKDGSTFWARRSGMRILDDEGNLRCTMGILEDITHERKARKELERREARFRALFERNPVGIVLADPVGRFVDFNEKFMESLGHERELLLSMNVEQAAHPASIRQLRRIIQQIKSKGEVVVAEGQYMHKSGKAVDCSLTAAPLLDENGELMGMIGMIEDLTVKRTAEILQRRQKDLERSNKELEQFVYVASHDLREPLRSIHALGELLKKTNGDNLNEQGRQCVDFMMTASQRMDVLIKGLLDYSRLGSKKVREYICLSDLVREVLDDLQVAVQEADATVHLDLPCSFQAYPNEVRLLVQNLLQNALKFRATDRKCEVSIACHEESSHWRISVTDNGIGIPEDKLKQVFYIFRRLHTAEAYPGTGIGLAHCHRIAQLHAGEIWVESILGEGSTFHVTVSKFL